MKSRATVIYKSYMTYFHTFLPVYFYGMPDGKIYVVYAFFTKTENNQEGLEFVFAIHEDFRYNHKYDKIFTLDWTELSKADFMKKVDEPDQRIEIIEVRKNISSYEEAQIFLNSETEQIIQMSTFEKV